MCCDRPEIFWGCRLTLGVGQRKEMNIVSIGTLTLSIVHPREVFKPAILLNAAAIIAAHNLCVAPHKLCYVASRVMWSSCRLTRLRLPKTSESTVSSCT